jgi:hypothetical protein
MLAVVQNEQSPCRADERNNRFHETTLANRQPDCGRDRIQRLSGIRERREIDEVRKVIALDSTLADGDGQPRLSDAGAAGDGHELIFVDGIQKMFNGLVPADHACRRSGQKFCPTRSSETSARRCDRRLDRFAEEISFAGSIFYERNAGNRSAKCPSERRNVDT